jgi:hypothetical protein
MGKRSDGGADPQEQQRRRQRSIAEYERAVRRAVRDNVHLQSNSTALMARLGENDDNGDEMDQLRRTCRAMMALVAELQQQLSSSTDGRR